MTLRRAGLAAAVALTSTALLGAGCGEKDEPAPPPPPPRPPETAEKLPKLARGWKPFESRAEGFKLGRPPGWGKGRECFRKRDRAAVDATAALCSPDRLVSVVISADRSTPALDLPLNEFASRALAALSERGFRGRLEPGSPKGFRGRYEGVRLKATGKAEGGVRQRVEVVVLRRPRVANFTAVIAANAKQPTAPAVRLAERSLRTLRSRRVAESAASP